MSKPTIASLTAALAAALAAFNPPADPESPCP